VRAGYRAVTAIGKSKVRGRNMALQTTKCADKRGRRLQLFQLPAPAGHDVLRRTIAMQSRYNLQVFKSQFHIRKYHESQ
jgi:hypothetical protein